MSETSMPPDPFAGSGVRSFPTYEDVDPPRGIPVSEYTSPVSGPHPHLIRCQAIDSASRIVANLADCDAVTLLTLAELIEGWVTRGES